MTVPIRLLLFAVTIVVVFGFGYVVGTMVGPLN